MDLVYGERQNGILCFTKRKNIKNFLTTSYKYVIIYINNTTGALAEQSTFYGDVTFSNVGVALTATTIYITGGLANG